MQAKSLPRAGRPTPLQTVGYLIKGLRPKQWLKNAFIFPALLFSRSLLIPDKALAAGEMFLVFCLLAGSVYLINDVVDRDKDRRHPRKSRRPVAAGLITPRLATVTAMALAALSLGWAFRLGVWVGAIGAVYLAQNLLYSFWLKQIVLVDVFVVAVGFVARVLAGGAAIHVPISPWLLTTTILLALFLALAKRRHEVTSLADPQSHRGILAEYPLPLLDQLIGIVTSCTIVVYAVYTFLNSPRGLLVYTVPFVLFGLFRYLYLVHRRQGGGEPELLVVKDPALLGTMALWTVVTVFIVYGVKG
ncbi:MAG: phosphoribose diphosphate:decaprenyl-phosphate phosphoribosyltransferase [Firmicutes bacterium]|nr:phosphoribose diphosphate:decaprenyl-phosphate phosphoribosyltransferase [Bacillota bacterium]